MKLKLNLTALNLQMKKKVILFCNFNIDTQRLEGQKLRLNGNEIFLDSW